MNRIADVLEEGRHGIFGFSVKTTLLDEQIRGRVVVKHNVWDMKLRLPRHICGCFSAICGDNVETNLAEHKEEVRSTYVSDCPVGLAKRNRPRYEILLQ